MLLRPVHPIHYDLALLRRLEVRRDRAVAADRGRPDARSSGPSSTRAPLDVVVFAVAIWGAYLIRSMISGCSGWSRSGRPGSAPIFELVLRRRAAAVRPARAAVADARLGAAAGRRPAVQVDVRLPDRGAGRRLTGRRAARRSRRCRRSGSPSASIGVASSGGSPSGATRRWATDGRRPRSASAAPAVGMFLRVGVLNELQYRVNFFIQLLQSAIALGTGLAVHRRWSSARPRAQRLVAGRSCWR